MHALRHAYASVLLDAGETIEALAEYLGAPGHRTDFGAPGACWSRGAHTPAGKGVKRGEP